MRFKSIAFVFLSLFSVGALATSEKPPQEIRLGFIPGEGAAELKKNAESLGQVLQEKLGVKVSVVIPENYSKLIAMMKDKKVDMAFFTAMTFVFAEKEAGAKVLLKKVWEQPYYYSVILARPGIKKLEDLKGKTLAFVDEKSTSGSLYPKVMMKKKGINENTFFSKVSFSGNHRDSVLGLAEGKYDAVAVFSDDSQGQKSAWQKFTKSNMKPELIWISEPIPNDPFCVRQDFYERYPRFTHDVMFTLIDLKDDSKKRDVLKTLLGVSELQLATSRQYDPVREMVRDLNLRLDK